MKKGIKERWIAALNSGDYEQGVGSLSKDNQYCCLGVLCDLAAKDGVITATNKHSGVTFSTYTSFDGDDKYLPVSVQRWAGISSHNPTVYKDTMITLANLNDQSYDFNVISQVIEAVL